jgi:hypothetical protein
MNGLAKGLTLIAGISILASAGLAQNETTVIVERETVVPGTFNDPLSVRDNEVGDGFTVTVADDNGVFPKRSKFEGHIARIRYATRFHPASIDLRFDDVRYPDGHTQPIDAVPVPLDNHGIHRGRDGRMYMDMNRVNPGAYWAAGTVGGLIVGGIFHRPFLGGFIGGFIGAIAGESARHDADNYRVARKGDKIGILFRSDLHTGAASSAPPVEATRGEEVRLGDHVVSFPTDQRPIWEGDVLMVPLPAMSDEMDLDVNQQADGPIDIQKNDNALHLEQGSAEYRLNDESGTLRRPVENRDGVTYVPIEILASISTRTVYVNGTKLDKKT